MVGEHIAVIADWLTVAEVARKLNIGERWAHTLVTREKFTAVRTHLGWLIDPTSIEAYKPTRKPRNRSAA